LIDINIYPWTWCESIQTIFTIQYIIKMGTITDEDISLFLDDESIQDILNSIDSKKDTQSIIVNIILYLFNYPDLCNSNDWIQKIIILINDKKLGNNMLAPSLKNINIEHSFRYILDKLQLLENNEEMYFDNVCVTYDTFNEYIDCLYEWFLETNIKNVND